MKTLVKNLKNNQVYIRRTQDVFYKIYPKEVLLDSPQKIEFRLNLIKSISQYFFDYEWSQSTLVLKSQFFNGKHQRLNLSQLYSLAAYLDEIHSKNIYHGDIHIRNIFIINNRPILVDWEPCTLQMLNSRKIIKSHSRGIAIKDRNAKKIGPLTDKKGFLGLISKSAFNQLADTSEMENLTCKELLKYQVLIES